MFVLQAVDAEGESKESTVTEGGVDIGDSLQDELCKLWDMSMNSVSSTVISLNFKLTGQNETLCLKV